MVVEGVECDSDLISLSKKGITLQLACDDCVFVRLERPYAHVDPGVVVDDTELGCVSSGSAHVGIALSEAAERGRLSPSLVVHQAVDPGLHALGKADRQSAKIVRIERAHVDDAVRVAPGVRRGYLQPYRGDGIRRGLGKSLLLHLGQRRSGCRGQQHKKNDQPHEVRGPGPGGGGSRAGCHGLDD